MLPNALETDKGSAQGFLLGSSASPVQVPQEQNRCRMSDSTGCVGVHWHLALQILSPLVALLCFYTDFCCCYLLNFI